MAFYLGKIFQVAGLGLAAIALYAGLVEESMSRELGLLMAGAVCFLVGRLIESRGSGGGT